MAIEQGATNAFRTGLPSGTFNFASDTFKIALYIATADLGPATSAYTTSGEITGTGYSAGGLVLTVSVQPTVGADPNNTVAYLSFNNALWNPAAFTCRGALIYKSGGGNPTVCVLDFGSDKTCTTTFEIQFPSATSTSAIIRIA
ncbi:MAG: hypothetical protein EB103_05030 [Actinobacteria bacterium]|nr:hypothetical protein [Actinomycetota bacterium]